MTEDIVIQKMEERDLPEVMEIESVSFPTPFTINLFRMEMNLNVAHLYVARVKASGGGSPAAGSGEPTEKQMGGSGGERLSPPDLAKGRVAGYLDFWRVGPEVHLITIATHPDCRRQGIGSLLVSFLLEEARKYGVETVWLDVRPSNETGLRLYRKFGFREIGVRKKYYQDNDEDALILSLSL